MNPMATNSSGEKKTPPAFRTDGMLQSLQDILSPKIDYSGCTPTSPENKALRELWDMPETTTRFEFFKYPFTVKDYPFTVEGVYGFLHDNSFNAADLKDIIFGVIVVKLVDSKLIKPNNDSAFDIGVSAKKNIPKVLDEAKLEMFSSVSKTMILVALHVHCKGIFDPMSDSFYRSFCSLKESSFLSQWKFNSILKMLISSGQFTEITKIITVGDIKSDNNVFKHKLTWLSSPDLIKEALKALPYVPILARFDPDALTNYDNFHVAGVLAQVASGPLAPYCKGEVDVIKDGVENIPDDLPLCALKAIEPPYDEKTIKRAYIILEETKYNFGNSYRGKKPMRFFSPDDMLFRATVRAVIKAIQNSDTSLKSVLYDSPTSNQEREASSGNKN